MRYACAGERRVAGAHGMIEVDHGRHQRRREHADAAEVEQVQAAVRAHRVVAEMRVAVQHAVLEERHVPGAEHGDRELGALRARAIAGA